MTHQLQPFVYLDIYGRRREFKLYDKSTPWDDVPGLYVFVSQGSLLGGYGVQYVGQTVSFRDRIPNHERWAEAQRRGARWVGALVETSAAERNRLEAEMIQRRQPPLNDQLKSPQQNALIGLLRRA